MSYKNPIPLFDSIDFIEDVECPTGINSDDFNAAKQFLIAYKGTPATFNTYRREVERLMQWTWIVAKKSIRELRRKDLETYIQFCQKPPVRWVGIKKPPRFIDQNGMRIPNPEWRPFVVTLPKAAHRQGKKPNVKDFEFSNTAIKDLFAVLSTFYNFLIAEDYTEVNPVLQIRQKSRFIQRSQTETKIRRLSQLQWDYVIRAAEEMAASDPEQHMRTLFIMNALFAMYLRISELAASDRWTPKMCDFYRDHDNDWWFITVGKGNKKRQIAVSDAMLAALKQWRKYLKLSPLPSPADQSPLLPKTKGKGPITSTTYIRRLVQTCFDSAIDRLRQDNKAEEAESLLDATVHWLRHTGISEDVKTRPREHVRDDAGHSSSAITDHYIDIELKERHASARKKHIRQKDK